jgi:hypothetical protein
MDAIVDAVAADPTIGEEIKGTGGCRKVRFAGRGKGKSGGHRVVTFYTGIELPVFLLAVFSKGQRSDLSQRERNALRDLTKAMPNTYGRSRGTPKSRRM